MKLVLSSFVLLCVFGLSGIAFGQSNAEVYKISGYTWCNGPVQGATAGCWPFGWQRVDLGHIVKVEIDTLSKTNYFTLTDSSGNTWSANFTFCPNGTSSNCNAKYTADNKSLNIDFEEPNDYSLSVTIDDKDIQLFVAYDAQSSFVVMNYSK